LNDDKSDLFMTQVETRNAEYDKTLHEERERIYAYIGDEHGYLKVWDLSYVLK